MPNEQAQLIILSFCFRDHYVKEAGPNANNYRGPDQKNVSGSRVSVCGPNLHLVRGWSATSFRRPNVALVRGSMKKKAGYSIETQL